MFRSIISWCKKATCIEKDNLAYKIILENKSSLREENLVVINDDALSFLSKNKGNKYDYVYLDPPFAKKELLLKCLDFLCENEKIKENGKIIIETDWQDFSYANNGFVISKAKKYGKIFIYFIERKIFV